MDYSTKNPVLKHFCFATLLYKKAHKNPAGIANLLGCFLLRNAGQV
jgi:hypothetical protein